MRREGQPIVVGFDGSDAARDALRLAELLAEALDSPLRPGWVHGDGVSDETLEEVRRALRSAADRELELLPIASSSEARGLHDEAERLGARAVVLGSTHRAGLGRVFPGSVATRLLHGAPCAVAVAPRGYERTAPPDLRVIQIAFDGSPESWLAVTQGGAIAEAAGATVRLFAVVGPPRSGTGGVLTQTGGTPPVVDLGDYLHHEIESARESLPPGVRPDARVLKGDVVKNLLDEAEKGVDLIVMGSRGYGPVHYALVGGVSSAIAEDAPCPVLLVPRGAGHTDATS